MQTKDFVTAFRPKDGDLIYGRAEARGAYFAQFTPSQVKASSLKYFCQDCGVRTHELGSADYMGGDFVGVFVNTVDDVEPLELVTAPVRFADGLNDNCQSAPAEGRHL